MNTKHDYDSNSNIDIEFDAQLHGSSNAQSSKDAGLWHFGAVYTAEGITLVLDPIQSSRSCIRRTQTVAGDLGDCYIVSGELEFLLLLIKHLDELFAGDKYDSVTELNLFKEAVSKYKDIGCVKIQESVITAGITNEPSVGTYPGNINPDAKPLWDSIIESAKYAKHSKRLSSLQRWNLAVRLFLDKCNRAGVSPTYKKRKEKTLESLNQNYSKQRNLASMLERQVFGNLNDLGLVEDYDRGVWKFYAVAYVNKRYTIILETRWLSQTNDPTKIAKHLIREEDFQKSESGGWEHSVSPTCKVQVRFRKFPDINFRMFLSFSKDILLDLGVSGRNRDEVLSKFDGIARDWARTRKFHKVKP